MKVVKVRRAIPRSNRKVKRKVVNDDPWLEGWMYRKSHVINPASDAGTNYQVRIVAHYGSGTDSGADVYLNGKCRSDFGDVRFTRSDGVTLLDYWMQEKVDGDYAVFWVEVADDLSTNPVTIYIYYGNATATTTSNGDNTFIFFDDFEVDLSKWTVTGTVGLSTDYAYQGSKSVKIGTGSTNISRNPNLSNIAHGVKYYDRMTAKKEKHVMKATTATEAYEGVDEDQSTGYYIYRIGATNYVSNVSRSVGWHSFEIRQTPTKTYFVIDGVVQSNTGSGGTVTAQALGSWWSANNEVSYFDCSYIRKFVDPEPSHGSWGSEETAVIERAVNVSNESVNPTSGFEGDGVTYQATVLDSAGEPLPSSFVADLVMDSIVLVNDKAFTSDVYNPSNGLLTLQFTVPNVLGTRTVRLEALLTDNAGNPLGGKTLTFKHKFSSESSWTTDGTQVTGSDGKASLTIDVETREYCDFRVEFAGDSTYEASYDEELNVYIAPKTNYTVKLVWLEQTI
jgi:hypothetical protein